MRTRAALRRPVGAIFVLGTRRRRVDTLLGAQPLTARCGVWSRGVVVADRPAIVEAAAGLLVVYSLAAGLCGLLHMRSSELASGL